MKYRYRLRSVLTILFVALVLTFSFLPALDVKASSPTDEILNYTITADVNDDATVSFVYDISWKVLESDSLGPVEWLEIGIPNSHCVFTLALTDNIDYISTEKYSVKIYFKDKYYEDEVIDFKFQIDMDYMYSMNEKTDGYTLYSYTPGWFDEITVDQLNILWNSDKVDSWSSGAFIEGDYIVWSSSLAPGERYTVEVSYPNDAYAFMETKSYVDDNGSYDSDDSDSDLVGFLALIFVCGVFAVPIFVIKKVFGLLFDIGSGFGTATQQKVTRTKIEYFPTCPGCGASREEGKETCPYCNRNLVKSRTVIQEDKAQGADKEALRYKSNGEYRYSSNPNTYVRVNVVNVPVPRPARTYSSSSSSSSHSSCAHSSCAHSSCACACACACAGGGRAGCTTKDFYNTNLKLAFLKRKAKVNITK